MLGAARKYSWRTVWLGIYAVACILIPPIHFHLTGAVMDPKGGKFFFAAEYLLLPLVFEFFWKLIKGEIPPPPRILIFVLAACTLAFIAGFFRADIGKDIGVYYDLAYDRFSPVKDGVSFIRWSLIFSTPWIVACVFKKDRSTVEINFFWDILKGAVFLSAVLAILDYVNLISLQKMGYHEYSQWWIGRSDGTQASPLEASLIYGGMVVYVSSQTLGRSTKANLNDAAVLLSCFIALLLTKTATSLAAVLLTLALFIGGNKISKKQRLLILAIIVAVGLILFSQSPKIFLDKLGDFTTRTVVWQRYLHVLQDKPWLLLSGIGFSAVVVDNSLLTLFIKGGLFLLLSVGAWMTKLYKFIPPSFRPVYFFWGLTFLALDSIGYWTLGRILWFSLGLFYSSRLVTDNELKTRNSAPRGSTPS